jgi:hypothetical protein
MVAIANGYAERPSLKRVGPTMIVFQFPVPVLHFDEHASCTIIVSCFTQDFGQLTVRLGAKGLLGLKSQPLQPRFRVSRATRDSPIGKAVKIQLPLVGPTLPAIIDDRICRGISQIKNRRFQVNFAKIETPSDTSAQETYTAFRAKTIAEGNSPLDACTVRNDC